MLCIDGMLLGVSDGELGKREEINRNRTSKRTGRDGQAALMLGTQARAKGDAPKTGGVRSNGEAVRWEGRACQRNCR